MKMLNYLTWSSEAERIQGYSLWNTVVLHRILVMHTILGMHSIRTIKEKHFGSKKAVEVSGG
jgi:hypothetical protein